LTNPGTIGTVASVPRLMKGQGSIIATGAIRTIGPTKVMTLTSTYDRRVLQGAASGVFLRKSNSYLLGVDLLYEQVEDAVATTSPARRSPRHTPSCRRPTAARSPTRSSTSVATWSACGCGR